MFEFFKRLFGRKPAAPAPVPFSQTQAARDYGRVEADKIVAAAQTSMATSPIRATDARRQPWSDGPRQQPKERFAQEQAQRHATARRQTDERRTQIGSSDDYLTNPLHPLNPLSASIYSSQAPAPHHHHYSSPPCAPAPAPDMSWSPSPSPSSDNGGCSFDSGSSSSSSGGDSGGGW